MQKRWIFALLVCLMVFAAALPAAASPRAQAVDFPAVELKQVAAGFTRPVGITNAGDESGRLFVVEQNGVVRWISGNRQGIFLDIRSKVSCCGERGLLGLAFPPGFASKRYFYVNYTNLAGHTVVARYSVSADPNAANPGSEVVVLTVDQPFENHNGGMIEFGPDGFLYIGMGDGGSGGDPENRAQTTDKLLGKMLRIDTEGVGCVTSPPRAGKNYCVPNSNPYVGVSGYLPEIWALGLRNPWRFSFDRQTGDLYIADVGQNNLEEVNFQPASSGGGENYGWRIFEGTACYNPPTGCTAPPNYSPPVAVYNHNPNGDGGCSVTGGYVYRGPLFAALRGIYVYGDLCSGKIYGLTNQGGWEQGLLATAPFSITTFGEDERGYLYVADYGGGAIYRIDAEIDRAELPETILFPYLWR